MAITALSIPQGIVQVVALPSWNQWKGSWNSTTTYLVNDVVFDGYSSYIALAPNKAKQPTANIAASSGSGTPAVWAPVALGIDPTVLNAAKADAISARDQAQAAAVVAANSATLAASQIGGAANAADNAAAYSVASQASRLASETAAGASYTYSLNALQAWQDATTQAAAAAAAKDAAQTYSTQSAASATLAQSWATKPSGEVVAGQGYSSYYWAQQASTSASNAAAAAGFNPADYLRVNGVNPSTAKQTFNAGINLAPGGTPASSADGDLRVLTTGLFLRLGGTERAILDADTQADSDFYGSFYGAL